MIALFTDFGVEGPYLGQVHAVLKTLAPEVPVVDLMSDLPPFAVNSAAYLLPAFIRPFPAGTVFLCVVDPGVGGDRPAVVVDTGRFRFVGPGNGLFDVVLKRSPDARLWRLPPPGPQVPASFHGRDVFAPVAASIARGEWRGAEPVEVDQHRLRALPDDLEAVAYVDRYGNAMTGIRATRLDRSARLEVGGRRLSWARTFCAVRSGQPFWYENASGLVEIAVREGNAAQILGLRPGTPVRILTS